MPFPFDQVLEATPSNPSIQNIIHPVFLPFIDFNRWGWGYFLPRKGIVRRQIKEGNMLYGVDADRWGKLQLISPIENNLRDFVRAQASIVQFATGATGDEIFCIKPYSVAYFEGWGKGSSLVCVFLMTRLSPQHFRPEMVHNFLKS